MSQAFTEAAARVKAKGKEAGISNDQALQLYGLYKQALNGDNTEDEPSFYQLEAKAKWKAYTSRKGLSKEQAETEYVALVKQLLKE
jgi:diazepam-binding inhibitor (GABA receptor modulating acyl-CoA-binding protein)